MSKVLFVALVVGALGCVLRIAAARLSARSTDLVGSPLTEARLGGVRGPATGGLDDAALRREIEALLRQRKKIRAVKVLRDHRPLLSLVEAKRAVESIEVGGPLPGGPATTADPGLDVLERVRRLRDANRKIEAIKVLREHTGMSLAEAKAAVERM
ncbi:ribosomal protein L7/L12 [Planosporangium sp. 12N6]|uniref:ribosomal protein L7/L12 n=1 Tax=Planosporangium spinosum TaxID=3402278 RepID=UPI003CF27DFA